MPKISLFCFLYLLLQTPTNESNFDPALITRTEQVTVDRFRFLNSEESLRLRTPSPDPDYEPPTNHYDQEQLRRDFRVGEGKLKDYSLRTFGSWKPTNITDGLARLLLGQDPPDQLEAGPCRDNETQLRCSALDCIGIYQSEPANETSRSLDAGDSESDALAAAYSDEFSGAPPPPLLKAVIGEMEKCEVMLPCFGLSTCHHIAARF
jgi:hypothetical protein